MIYKAYPNEYLIPFENWEEYYQLSEEDVLLREVPFEIYERDCLLFGDEEEKLMNEMQEWILNSFEKDKKLPEKPKLKASKKKWRKPRKWEYVCNCEAYSFPHRFWGGYCKGMFIVRENFNDNLCDNCVELRYDKISRCYAMKTCEVLNWWESVKECPAWQEFVDYNEIKIYF